MTSYRTVYDRFSNKITDFKILDLKDEDVQTMLLMWMTSAIAKFKKIKSDLSNRDDEVLRFTDDLLDIEIEVLAMMMVTEWLEPQLNSELYTAQFYGGKEERFFAQANQLDKLMVLKSKNEIACKKAIRDYGYRSFVENRG